MEGAALNERRPGSTPVHTAAASNMPLGHCPHNPSLRALSMNVCNKESSLCDPPEPAYHNSFCANLFGG